MRIPFEEGEMVMAAAHCGWVLFTTNVVFHVPYMAISMFIFVIS
jgi:hypothetical protein